MNQDQDAKNAPKYADSSISDKAFKRMLFWFFLYCSVFIIGVILAVNADSIS
ncbi:hypothetical protein RFI02_15510 [Acinetobacter sichuanensis]|uniref:hypothetical protein n=1 Tax=Acinetobacter sichuanensis TaxID=2136183 RepID=UPI00280FD8A4|nr:hypothetical protein [Acinetobacter sichuanensis]MDQ9022516.1 hypothetical protein [Acinetobacter sichuanensis]